MIGDFFRMLRTPSGWLTLALLYGYIYGLLSAASWVDDHFTHDWPMILRVIVGMMVGLSLGSVFMSRPVQHVVTCVLNAVDHPKDAWRGAREFRSHLTFHYEDRDRLESYDSGRELAHLLTFRRWDW